jgi:hypothetical protein
MYLPSLLFMAGTGAGFLILGLDGKTFFCAAALFVLSFALRTIDMPACSYLPIGTHYFWHIFNAAVLFLLVRALIVFAPVAGKATPQHSYPLRSS